MKDAKGHGSDKRGAAGADERYAHVMASTKAASDNLQKLIDQHATGGQPVTSNAHAAATLASGSKSAPVPVHPAQQGFTLKASASENPKSPKVDQQDYQERQYRYNGSNSKAAVNWGLKKIQDEFPDHRRHEVEIVR